MRLKNENREHFQERFTLKSPFAAGNMASEIARHIPSRACPVVLVCIGTDRSTGDSLGPLTGTLLKERRPANLHIYGTLDAPVHGKNLRTYLQLIKDSHPEGFVIAVDACLGKVSSIGTFVIGTGPINPGAALKKDLPPVGHMHIAGIVNAGGIMEFLVLQNTRLNLVMQMARKLSETLKRVDRELTRRNDLSDRTSAHLKSEV